MSYVIDEVLSDTPHRAWGPDGKPPNHYFCVKLEDGTVAEAGKKKPDNPPRKGDRYKQLNQPGANAPQGALPTLTGPITDFQGNGAKDFKADPKNLRSQNARSAVTHATELVVADKIALDQLSLYAEKFYDFIEAKAKVDSGEA